MGKGFLSGPIVLWLIPLGVFVPNMSTWLTNHISKRKLVVQRPALRVPFWLVMVDGAAKVATNLGVQVSSQS